MSEEATDKPDLRFTMRHVIAMMGVVSLLVAVPRLSHHLPPVAHVAVGAMVVIVSLGGLFGFAVLALQVIISVGASQPRRSMDLRSLIVTALVCILAQVPLISFAFQSASR